VRAHIVLAHPEPQSYNAHLARTAQSALQARGWTTTLSDLYAQGFDPCERAAHYPAALHPERFDAQAEQRHASQQRALPEAVRQEVAHLDAADLLILQFPLWWHMPPAMLKGWFDRVFAFGEVYRSNQRFEYGRFAGKRAMLSVTVGTSEATYGHDGRSGDIDLMLWPINFSLAYVGFTVLQHFVGYGVEGTLRYSDPAAIEARLARIPQDWAQSLTEIDTRAVIPFNRMADWGTDGRIKPDAPVYSPYIRRFKDLPLE